tara:strand:+ start:4481 stop:4915 length:435 start_codon:yes stop_codon:yes gene_type:complete
VIHFKPFTEKYEYDWFKDRVHIIYCEDSQGIIAYKNDGKIAGGVIFDTWTPDSVNVHIAIDDPLCIRGGLFTEVAIHGFHTGGKKRMFGMVPDNNKKALKLDKKIGFHEVARIPDAISDGIGYIILRLDKENCRWLPKELREAA